MVDTGTALNADQLEMAKATYQHSLDVLLAHQRAVGLAEKRAVVGRYYKHTETLRTDSTVGWQVYLAATSVDVDLNRLTGWHFQHVPTGQIEIAPDDDLQPGFLTDQCIEITRETFIVAFNELLTAIARFAQRVPIVTAASSSSSS
mgnify:CR=1 FL=1